MKSIPLTRRLLVLAIATLFASSLGPSGANYKVAASGASAQSTLRTIQFGAKGSYPYLLWTKRLVDVTPNLNLNATRDVVGLNLLTGQPITVTSDINNQTEVDIDGSIAVYESNSHSFHGGENNIRALNLQTGTKYAVATGPKDQSHPAISGSTAAWIEFDGQYARLLSRNITGVTPPIQITSVATNTHYALLPPVISSEYIVWAEIREGVGTTVSPSRIKAYNRQTGAIQTVANINSSRFNFAVQYALADHRVVWSNPQLHMYDLSTGVSTLLNGAITRTPAIAGNTVIWSQWSNNSISDLDIWGMDLTLKVPVPLVQAPGSQIHPDIVLGGVTTILAWQTDGGGSSDGVISNMPLPFSLVPGKVQPYGSSTSPGSTTGSTTGSTFENNSPSNEAPGSPSTIPPEKKGIHACNGDAWPNTPECTDSLHDSNDSPYFGSVLVLDDDLNKDTMRPAPWGPKVSDAMETLAGDSVRVIVRTSPTIHLEPNVPLSTNSLYQKVGQDAQNYPFITHLQIDNEPNREWPQECSYCSYDNNPGWTWNNDRDYRFYAFINSFYYRVADIIQTCDPNDPYCQALNDVAIWSPPMAEIYANASNGESYYRILYDMISVHDGLSYHVYPSPNWSGHADGGVDNPTWPWFTDQIRDQITNHTLRSQVTEWGWDPTNMDLCNMYQHSTWPRGQHPPGEGCTSNDDAEHTFYGDIQHYLANPNHLREAEAVCVWLIKRGTGVTYSNRADGLQANGQNWQWLTDYQHSSP